MSAMSKDEDTPPISGNTVLVCVDDSQHSAHAFNWYCDNFHCINDLLAIAHIYEQADTLEIFDPDDIEYQRRVLTVLDKSKTITKAFEEACAQRCIKYLVLTEEKIDNVGKTICKMADQNDVSCIVMGSRGLGLVKRTVVGSVSDYVIHNAHVPVLIVPPPAKDENK